MPQLANKEICTGCMACMNACGKGALTFAKDEEGFLQPSIDTDKCVECGQCERSCPEIQQQYHLHDTTPEVFAGWNKTDRRVSSSGGAFSSIARCVLSKGGVVFGATLDEGLQCKHIEVDGLETLTKLRGSKYIQSNIGEAYKHVKQHLASDRYVLFSGTPCQVSGLKSYLGKKDYPKLVTIDLICHGVPSQAVFDEYINKLKNRLGKTEVGIVANYEFRRRDGWGIAPSVTTTINSSVNLYETDALYMSAFDRAAIFRRSCYSCHYAKIHRVGDFTLGDFWGIGEQGVPFKHDIEKGVSLLLVNSDKGREIFNQLGEDDFYEKRSLDEAVARNHNLTKTSPRNKDRENVIKAFLDNATTLDDIEKKYHLLDRSLKRSVRNLTMKLGLYKKIKKIQNACWK